MKFLDKLSNILYKITGIWITGSLFFIVGLAFIQVISRFVFKFSIQWSQELIVYMMMWLVFLGCSMGLRDHEVASLTMVVNRLSPKWKIIVEMLVDLILIAFFIIAITANMELIKLASARKSSIMKINMAFQATAFSVGMGLSCFYTILEFFKDAIRLIKKDYDLERYKGAKI